MKIRNESWDDFYRDTPLDQIPWQKTQADWFHKLLNKGDIKGNSALDLGCGTGKKSIMLTKYGFTRVVGIDISKTAISYAKKNSKIEKVNDTVKFYCKDATDLSFLKNKKFEFILDWANLHGLPKKKRSQYISQIAKHSKPKSQLLLRCFSKRGNNNQEFFEAEMSGITNKIYLFSRKDIDQLYCDYFEIKKTNLSKPRTKIGYEFDEYLMEKK